MYFLTGKRTTDAAAADKELINILKGKWTKLYTLTIHFHIFFQNTPCFIYFLVKLIQNFTSNADSMLGLALDAASFVWISQEFRACVHARQK